MDAKLPAKTNFEKIIKGFLKISPDERMSLEQALLILDEKIVKKFLKIFPAKRMSSE